MSENTNIVPARPLTTDDVDAIIATRQEMDRAFWRALGAVRKSGGASANEIARRVHAAGIASRPTTLDRLRDAAISDLPSDLEKLAAECQRVSEATRRAAATFSALQEAMSP